MKDDSVRLGFIFSIFLLFIGVSISPSIIGNVEKITNPSIDKFSINSNTENFGLLAYWNFDEGSGNLAHDTSGNGFHGTITGALWTTGYSGYALDFDGEANNVNLDLYSKDLGFNKTDYYKISAWINSESTESGVIYMISYSSTPPITTPIFYIKFNFDGTLQMKVQSTPICELIINSTDIYYDGLWHNIEGIYYGGGSKLNPVIELYVDSQLVGRDSDWLCPMTSSWFKTAKIGMASYENTEFFNGIIDEIKVFKIPNNPPNKPIINGKINGKSNTEYEYKFVSTDPDGDNVTYCIDWGDNTSEVCIGPFPSGAEASAKHTWSEKGDYAIKAQAQDMKDAWSDLSTLIVSMPNDRGINLFFPEFLQKFFQRFPLLEKILNQYNN